MLRLAARMAAVRVAALLAVFCAVLGAAALVTATAVLADTGLRGGLPPGRLAGADIVVAADQEFHPPGDPAVALPERRRIPAAFVERLAGLPGVTSAVGDTGFPVALVGSRGQTVPAVDPGPGGHGWSSTGLLAHPRVEGRAPRGTGEVAVSAALSGAAGVGVGDEVRVLAGDRAATSYRVSAVVDAPGAGVYLADSTAVRLSGRAGSVDLVGLRTASGAREKAAAAVREAVRGTGLAVRTGDEVGAAVSPGADAATSQLVLIAASLAGIVLLVTGFVTAGALGVAIAGQRRDLALMRAVGATPRQIRRLAAGQSTLVAAVALAPGIALGYLLAGAFRDTLVDRGVLPSELPLVVGPLPASATALLMTGVVRLAARGAAWRTSRMPATEAVAESRSEPRRQSRTRTGAGLLLMVAACALGVLPLLSRTVLGAAGSSLAGIVAAIGLALAGPALVARAGAVALRRLRPGADVSTWLALSNVRAYAQRVAGVVSPLAMAVAFVLTYVLTQTTVLAATTDDVRTGTLAQYRLDSPGTGGLPQGTPAAVRELPGVRAAAASGSTTAIWQYDVFGDPNSEASAAQILAPDAAGVLDLGVREGSLSALTGASVAVADDMARMRDAGPGRRIRLVLGDGTSAEARVVAVYDRGLGFGPLVLSRDLAAGHTTTGAEQSLLVRTDGSAAAERALTAFAADRPGLVLTATDPAADADTPPEVWINLALVVVLLGYLLLSIANRLVAATSQRRVEIAALRLVGTTPRQIRAMMRREASVVAGAAVGSGLLLSALPLALLGLGFLGRPWPAGPGWLLPAVLATVVVTAFVTVEFPTRAALRREPAETIRSA